jgi:hypothetical protein
MGRLLSPIVVQKSVLFESKTTCEHLAASDPANAKWQRDLWMLYWGLADLCEKPGQAAEAQG